MKHTSTALTWLIVVAAIASSCGAPKENLIENYTLPPFKLGLKRRQIGAVLQVDRFEVRDSRASNGLSAEASLVPDDVYPVLVGVPPIHWGKDGAPTEVGRGTANFDSQETDIRDVCARYFGYALQNAGLFEDLYIVANQKDGDPAPPPADYVLRGVLYPDLHVIRTSSQSQSMLGGLFGGGTTIATKHVVSLDLQVVDRAGRTVLSLPVDFTNYFAIGSEAKCDPTITPREFGMTGFREALSIVADYLIEGLLVGEGDPLGRG